MLNSGDCKKEKEIAVVCQNNLDRETADNGECVSGKQDLLHPIEKACLNLSLYFIPIYYIILMIICRMELQPEEICYYICLMTRKLNNLFKKVI